MKKRRRDASINQGTRDEDLPRKKTKSYTEAELDIARLYDTLASQDKQQRVSAAEKYLEIHRKEVAATKTDHFTLLERPLIRLVRGLCSNRKAARLGFYMVLSEMLQLLKIDDSHLEVKTLEQYLALVDANTQADNGASNQERRDCLFGYIFALSVLLQQDLCLGPSVPEDMLVTIVQRLCSVAAERPWLQEECGMALYQALLIDFPTGYVLRMTSVIIEAQKRYELSKTPEGIAIWLHGLDKGLKIRHARKVWTHGSPVCEEELHNTARIMKQGRLEDSGASTPKGARQNSPNFAWTIILSHVFRLETPQQKLFSSFWRVAVDGVYFDENASVERKAAGFQILKLVAASGPPWTLPLALTPNVLHRLINHSSKAERYLHGIARSTLDSLEKRGAEDTITCRLLVERLISQEDGAVDFDKKTGTRMVQNLCSHLAASEIESLLQTCLVQHLRTAPKPERRRYLYQCVADVLLGVAKQWTARVAKSFIAGTLSQIVLILKLLARYGFTYVCISESVGDLSHDRVSLDPELQSIFRARFFSCLSQLLSINNSTVIDEVCNIPAFLQQLGHDRLVFLSHADSQILEVVREGEASYGRLRTASNSTPQHRPVLTGVCLIVSITMLRVYEGDANAIEILSDVQAAVQQVESEGLDHMDSATDALTELLLSLVSVPSTTSRKIVEQSFAAFAPEMNVNGTRILTRALLDPNPLNSAHVRGVSNRSELGQQLGSSTPSDLSDDGEDEGESSGESVSADIAEDDRSSADESSQRSGSEEARFDAMLAEALKTSKVSSTRGSSTGSDTDGETMDDDQMMAIEPHLAAVFRERRNAVGDGDSAHTKKSRRDETEQTSNFKHRVLDLLHTFVKIRHRSEAVIFAVVPPLLQFLRINNNKDLTVKAAEVLRQHFESARSRGMPKLSSRTDMLGLLRDIHAEALRGTSRQHAAACSKASIFAARVLIEAKRADHSTVMHIYAETAHEAFDRELALPDSFLTDGMAWSRSLRILAD